MRQIFFTPSGDRLNMFLNYMTTESCASWTSNNEQLQRIASIVYGFRCVYYNYQMLR